MRPKKQTCSRKLGFILSLALVAGVAHASERRVAPMCSQATFSNIEASLGKGSNATVKDRDLQLAAFKGNVQDVKKSASELKASEKGSNYDASYGDSLQRALLAASWIGHPKVVTELIGMGVNPNGEPNSKLGLPIFAAAQCGHIEVMKVLVLNGAGISKRSLNPDQKDAPTSAIEVAIVAGQNRSITWLLGHGFDVCGELEKDRIARLMRIPNFRKEISPRNIARLECR